MANHVRRQIRESVASTVTSLTTTGSRVYQSRVYPLEDTDLPALLVVAEVESSEGQTIHSPPLLQRIVSVDVIGIAKATADLDDTLDLIAKEVETAMAGATITGAKFVGAPQTDITMVGTAEKPTGRIRIRYDIEYFTAANAPDVAL